jgi:hypothetical protein
MSEVDGVRQGNECREAITFPDGKRLEYVLRRTGDSSMGVAFAGSPVCVEVPRAELEQWCNTSQVALSADIALPAGGALSVLIEKDYRCLDPGVREDQSDTFENPLESHGACDRG